MDLLAAYCRHSEYDGISTLQEVYSRAMSSRISLPIPPSWNDETRPRLPAVSRSVVVTFAASKEAVLALRALLADRILPSLRDLSIYPRSLLSVPVTVVFANSNATHKVHLNHFAKAFSAFGLVLGRWSIDNRRGERTIWFGSLEGARACADYFSRQRRVIFHRVEAELRVGLPSPLHLSTCDSASADPCVRLRCDAVLSGGDVLSVLSRIGRVEKVEARGLRVKVWFASAQDAEFCRYLVKSDCVRFPPWATVQLRRSRAEVEDENQWLRRRLSEGGFTLRQLREREEENRQLTRRLSDLEEANRRLMRRHRDLEPEVSARDFFCDVCDVQCNCESQFEAHLGGLRHQETQLDQ